MSATKSILVSAAACLALVASSNGGIIRSPDIAQTYAFASMVDHQLRWIRNRRALVATVTFSNVNYVSRTESKHEERFDFFLPGIRFSPKEGIFYDSEGIPVAKLRRVLVGSEIQLLPETKIYVTNRSGTVHLILSTTREPREGLRWVETDQTQWLPNILG